LDRREIFLILPLLIGTVAFGFFPNLILDTLHYPVSQLLVDFGTNEFSKYNYIFVNTSTSYIY
jgi:NADH:ubiquinone oxidoreductase subunit 4 (subunit M)